jgi:hypothetical protein
MADLAVGRLSVDRQHLLTPQSVNKFSTMMEEIADATPDGTGKTLSPSCQRCLSWRVLHSISGGCTEPTARDLSCWRRPAE